MITVVLQFPLPTYLLTPIYAIWTPCTLEALLTLADLCHFLAPTAGPSLALQKAAAGYMRLSSQDHVQQFLRETWKRLPHLSSSFQVYCQNRHTSSAVGIRR